MNRCKHTPGMTRPARPLRWRALARDTQTVSRDSMFLFESNLSDSVTQFSTYKGNSKSKERLNLPHSVVTPPCLTQSVSYFSWFLHDGVTLKGVTAFKTPPSIRYAISSFFFKSGKRFTHCHLLTDNSGLQ